MKELFRLTFSLDLRGLFISPSDNVAVQAFRALFVGGIVFVADAGILFALSLSGIYYLICAVLSFIIAVMLNYILSTKFVFKEKAKIKKSSEIAVYFIISAIGLGLTVGLMWLLTEIIGLFFMLSKAIATLTVFAWNFTSRKIILYRKKN